MEINLVTEGVKFMALGMGTVFLFLIMLIFTLQLQARMVERFLKPKEATAPALGITTPQKDSKKIVAAISAAIMKYRNS